MEAIINKDYIAHLDTKHRITLRGTQYSYYHVKEYDNGCILLEPRELVAPTTISARTLMVMDEAINNYTTGRVSEPIDLSEFE